jgi:hypothetical protein
MKFCLANHSSLTTGSCSIWLLPDVGLTCDLISFFPEIPTMRNTSSQRPFLQTNKLPPPLIRCDFLQHVIPIIPLTTPWPESASELYRPCDRRLLENLVSTFADRGCHVVSVTYAYGRNLGFLDRSRYFFLSSSSSIVLTRLSGPRSRPPISQKSW